MDCGGESPNERDLDGELVLFEISDDGFFGGVAGTGCDHHQTGMVSRLLNDEQGVHLEAAAVCFSP